MEFFNDVGGDTSRPTLFELVAQEQLRDLLQPALKYILAVFAQRYPRYLLRIVNRHEEFYALLMLFVERHYLRRHGASFAENFYGLKRRRRPVLETGRAKVAVPGGLSEEKLRDKEIWRSLLFLVGLPYMRTKAQECYEILGGGVQSDAFDDEPQNSDTSVPSEVVRTLTDRLRHVYKAAYPWLNASFEVWLLMWNLRYLFEQTPFYRPWLALIGVDIRRLTMDDTVRQRPLFPPNHPSTLKKDGLLANLRRLITASPRLLLDSLKVLLPTAIFFIKFLEWWYSPSSPARMLSTTSAGPAVPPPRLLPPHPQGITVDMDKYGICPLCHDGLANATAMPSGYVFCYRCAYEYVEKFGRCPVTLLPVRVWQLRKILV
ncbi:hypothetical protein CERSUDRAFT_45034 [Gelatoporia subvermispora B]|uniref:Peroxisome assembly protein 12 n=1 Tax=Ceriporiopsis subvermispora (strain B) TaxID=914234 RepID=M2QUB9_CERS8|nr:hypothetical protein CERSUDRAFT_45034 [Gelatoporia subvermispora B]